MSRPRDGSAAASWDANASRYHTQERLEERAIEVAARYAGPFDQATLIDLATGTGAMLRALAAGPSRPAAVVGVDRSPGMLAEVGPLPGGWTTLEADARAVPLPDAGADVVTCAYLLHLLAPADRLAVLLEARRLLRPGPGSRIVVVTVWTAPGRLGGRLAGGALRAAAALAPGRLGGLAPLDPTGQLERAGFEVTHRCELPRAGYPSLVLRAVAAR